LGEDFGGGMPLQTNQLGLGKRQWNLETSSAEAEFPYFNYTIISANLVHHLKKCPL